MPVLINQSGAIAGSITPGDAPGFPITISKPGSYQLSSNLTATNQATTPTIEITVDDVTLDLNGYVISGAKGIFAADKKNITIMNGTIKDMNGIGAGPSCRIENLRLFHVLNGIQIGPYGLVKNCTIEAIDTGIFAQECCVVTGNSIQANELVVRTGQGSIIKGNTLYRLGPFGVNLETSGSVITDNTVTGVKNNIHDVEHVIGINANNGSMVTNNKVCNASIGLKLSNDTGYANNVLTNNNTHVSGGIKFGANVCGTTLCP